MASVLKYQQMLNELGYNLTKEAVILDFGCGKGRRVKDFRENGYRAFGCDIVSEPGEEGDDFIAMYQDKIIRIIDMGNYRIPFDNETFDFIFSEQVLEHIKDYNQSLSEIRRVLKPGGLSLHEFPSRYIFIEPHLNVPLGAIIQKKWWLTFLAFIGIRNKYQENNDYKTVANTNYDYLENHTNYLTKLQLINYFKKYFDNIIFCEDIALKYTRQHLKLYGTICSSPFLRAMVGTLISTFKTRLVCLS